jgi:DnaJ-class molecular chaperone
MSSAEETCGCCHGTGRLVCATCNGVGARLIVVHGSEDEEWDVCPECWGRKDSECPECHGSGLQLELMSPEAAAVPESGVTSTSK